MSGYVVNPADPTTPLDSQVAREGAEELRALKAYIATLAGLGGGMNIFRKNRIINGCFRLDQVKEGATAYAIPTVVQTVDQFSAFATAASGTFTVQREAGGLYSGEYNALLTVTAADAAMAVGDLYDFYTAIEGYDFADLQYGQAAAQTCVLSFEVKSSILGTFGVFFVNSVGNRSYVSSFTINAINTVERKTIVIPGDIAGAWLTTNGIGVLLGFCVASGTTPQTPTPNVWVAGNYQSVATQTNWMATNGNTLRIGRVQFEQSNVASPFERRATQIELALVQRYYEKTYEQGVAVGTFPANAGSIASIMVNLAGALLTGSPVTYKVTKRAAPTVTAYDDQSGAVGNWRENSSGTSNAYNIYRQGQDGVFGYIASPNPAAIATGHITANARLT